ncbi:MAG TPA: hypothetical protein VK525_06080 [Candidatus Saccharimonadales bacterium]|nr:hypothetical protein [Candidatus Saccharimonadales bacterium]
MKLVTAAALKATLQMEREMAARVEQMKASQPDLGQEAKSGSFMIGQNFYKDTLQDDSDPQAVILRNLRIHALNKIGMLDQWTHDGILEDKVYELAAVCKRPDLTVLVKPG